MKNLYNSVSILTFTAIAFVMISGCSSAKDSYNSPEKLAQIKSDVEQREFEIEFSAAYPLLTNSMVQLSNSGLLAPGNSASRIDLTSTPNFLRIKGDSITSELPFFGEQRVGGGAYNNRRTGVDIEGEIKDYNSQYSDKKGGYIISFEAKGTNENYDANMVVFNNGRCELNLTGTKRTPIRYSGRLILKKDEE